MNELEFAVIKKCQNGDIGAFEALVSKYEKIVYNIAYRLIGNAEDSKDVAQETFIKVYRKINTFKGDSSFSTWLYRMTVNTGKDFLRKKKDNLSIDEERENNISNVNTSLYTPEVSLERNEKQRMIIAGLNQLKTDHKVMIILRDIQGYSYEEISNTLEISIGTVKSRINRARMNLREILLENFDYS